MLRSLTDRGALDIECNHSAAFSAVLATMIKKQFNKLALISLFGFRIEVLRFFLDFRASDFEF